MKGVLGPGLLLCALLSSAAEVWPATAPKEWAPDIKTITLVNAGEGTFSFNHTGTKNWCVNATAEQAVEYGEKYVLSCQIDPLPGACTSNVSFQIGGVLRGEGKDVISWTFSERAVRPGRRVRISFGIPHNGRRLYTRLRGQGACAAQIRDYQLERVGSALGTDANGRRTVDLFDGDFGQRLPGRAGFFVRDVAAEGSYQALMNGGTVAGVKLSVQGEEAFDVTLADETGRDRALTLVYAVPLPAGELTWFADTRSREVVTNGEYSSTVQQGPVGRGQMSRWPFAAVGVAGKGFAIGLDPEAPAFNRLVLNATTRQLFVAFDLGLVPEKKSAHVRFRTFSFDTAQGFRGALVAYRALYPEMFRVRCPQQGVWTVHDRLRDTLPHPEDFGFRFRGRHGETKWDDEHGILTFRYTEPCTWWVNLPQAKPGEYTFEDGVARCEQLVKKGDARALAWKASVMEDEDGNPVGRCCAQSWCTGVLWAMNSAPGINGGVNNDFTAKLVPSAFDTRYPGTYPEGLDGEYMDSAELYVTPWCDYSRAHFAGMETPLCFDGDSLRPVIYKGLVAYEYVRAVGRLSHGKGRLTLTNCTPINWWWLVPHLDVLGSETWWLTDKGKGVYKWTPMTDGEFMYRRALCGGKPFCFLMDAPFDHFTKEMTEKFMQRSLAYGCFPGFFTWHGMTSFKSNLYFSRPDCYERDRPLFKKYIPLCKRIAEAGWQPINSLLESDNKKVITEQFGDAYATVFNLSDQPQTVHLKVLRPSVATLDELVTETQTVVVSDTVTLELPPETVRLFCIK